MSCSVIASKRKKYVDYTREQSILDIKRRVHLYSGDELVSRKYIDNTGIENVVNDVLTRFKDAGYEVEVFEVNIAFSKKIDDKHKVVQVVKMEDCENNII